MTTEQTLKRKYVANVKSIIKHARLAMTAKEIAKYCGVSRSLVYRWEEDDRADIKHGIAIGRLETLTLKWFGDNLPHLKRAVSNAFPEMVIKEEQVTHRRGRNKKKSPLTTKVPWDTKFYTRIDKRGRMFNHEGDHIATKNGMQIIPVKQRTLIRPSFSFKEEDNHYD